MLRLDTFIVAEFVSMLNFFYKKMPGSRLATPTFIIEPQYKDFQTNLRKKLEGKQFAWEGETWIKIAKERAHKQKDY